MGAVRKTLFFQANLIGNLSKFPSYIAEKIDSNQVIPHYGRYSFKSSGFYGYPLITGFLQYSPRPYLAISLGVDKRFIGDGYRSMLLSDNSAPYPFVELTVPIWRIKYIILWAFLKDIDSYSGNSDFHEKYAVIHYFSYNVTERLNLGFFEAIVWRGNDTSGNRGFDPNYANPVIFFRPVEFSLNSPDNANLGGSLKLRFWKRTYFYSQLFLDDFTVGKFIKRDGWWGNKYGIQTGFKSFSFAGCRNLFMQGEFNFARPYTYSEHTSLVNYGNEYQALAHPLGANFWELVGITRYLQKNWLITLKATGAVYGADTSLRSFGQNIYKPYDLRYYNIPKSQWQVSDYNNHIGQGLKTKLLNIETKLSYSLIPKWNLYATMGYRLIASKNNIDSGLDNYFFIGISTYLYNNDVDY